MKIAYLIDFNVIFRDGPDLHMKYDVTLTEALCGFTMIIKHLDGRNLVIKNPPGSTLQPGNYYLYNFLYYFEV